MLFTSYVFFLFLILLFIIYYIIPKKYQWMLLLCASYIFYCFAGIEYLLFIVSTTVTTYVVTHKIGKIQSKQSEFLKLNKETMSRDERKEYKNRMKAKQREWMVICLLFNFGILAIIKYSNFAIQNINALMRFYNPERELSYLNLLVPLGISFYTFQSMGYVIDIYREKYEYEKNIFKLALFVSFFPQLIQGPISRFNELGETLYKEHPFDIKNVQLGLLRIIWGYFKKIVIADRLIVGVSIITGNPDKYYGVYVLAGMLFYAIELYADFSGGIDITIGIAEVLGIRLKENFNRPYFSKSISEYWRRWHITLGTWFKDYIFYPISVSEPVIKLSSKSRQKLGNGVGKRIPLYMATITVWLTTGIWHGSSWNFVVWGLLNGLIILASYECTPLYNGFHKKFNVINTFWYRSFQVLRTFWLMCFLRTLDCYKGVLQTFKMIGSIFTSSNFKVLDIGLKTSDFIVLIFAVSALFMVSMIQRKNSVREIIYSKPLILRYCVYFLLIVTILIFGAYGTGYESSNFIYSQF